MTAIGSLNALVSSMREREQQLNDEAAEEDTVSEHMCGARTAADGGAGVHRRPSFLYSDNSDVKYKNYGGSPRCYSVGKGRPSSAVSTISRCNTYTAKTRTAALAASRCNSNRRPLRSSFNIPRYAFLFYSTPLRFIFFNSDLLIFYCFFSRYNCVRIFDKRKR